MSDRKIGVPLGTKYPPRTPSFVLIRLVTGTGGNTRIVSLQTLSSSLTLLIAS